MKTTKNLRIVKPPEPVLTPIQIRERDEMIAVNKQLDDAASIVMAVIEAERLIGGTWQWEPHAQRVIGKAMRRWVWRSEDQP